MTKSPGYFNRSLWDTISGEYYGVLLRKKIIFTFSTTGDGMNETDETLARYDWELAPDTQTTWRIGDGTVVL